MNQVEKNNKMKENTKQKLIDEDTDLGRLLFFKGTVYPNLLKLWITTKTCL